MGKPFHDLLFVSVGGISYSALKLNLSPNWRIMSFVKYYFSLIQPYRHCQQKISRFFYCNYLRVILRMNDLFLLMPSVFGINVSFESACLYSRTIFNGITVRVISIEGYAGIQSLLVYYIGHIHM